MREDYVWDKTGDAEPDLLVLEKTLSTLRHERPLGPLPTQAYVDGRRRPSWARPVLLGALLSSTLTVLLIWGFLRISGTPPTVVQTEATPSVIAPVTAPPPKRTSKRPPKPEPVESQAEDNADRIAEIERLLTELNAGLAKVNAAVARIEERQRAAPTTAAPPKAKRRFVPSKPPGEASVDCILDPSKCTPKRAVDPTLPEKLSTSEIKKGVLTAKTEAKVCGAKHGATPGEKVRVKMTISGATGRVTSAAAQGAHAISALGTCVAAAFKKARFPRFRKTTLGVQYPVRM